MLWLIVVVESLVLYDGWLSWLFCQSSIGNYLDEMNSTNTQTVNVPHS